MRLPFLNTYVLLIFLVHLFLSSFYLDSWKNPNTTSRVMQVISLHEDRSLHIDNYHEQTIDKAFVNGHYFPLQPPLPSLLIWPVYEMISAIVPPETAEAGERRVFLLGSFLCGSLPFALLIMLVRRQLLNNGMSPVRAVLVSALPFYGSMFFVYAGTFYGHLLVCLCVVMAYKLLSEGQSFLWAGLLCGAAFLSEYLTAVLFFAWFFLVWYNKSFRSALLFATGLLPFIAGFLLYNYFTTGNLLLTPYSFNLQYDMERVGFTYPKITAVFSMFFLPWRGALFYLPVLWALAYTVWRDRIWKESTLFTGYLFLPALFFVLTLSSYQEWHGGWTFGPRYLFPVLGLVLFAGIPRIRSGGLTGFWYWIPVLFGLIYAFMAKITVLYSIPSAFRSPLVQYVFPKLQSGTFNDGNSLTQAFHMPPVWAAVIFIVLFGSGIALLIEHTNSRRE